MKTEVNDKKIWNEIYEKEEFTPGWASPGLDGNLLKIVKEEIDDVAGEVTILDIGCGNGRNSLIAEELGNIKYTGADFADKAIAYCKEKHSKDKTFIHLDITADNLPLEDSYRVIFDCGCFHAIPPEKREKYIKNLRKHSNKDTLVIIGAWWREPEHKETDKPSYFPYLYLDEWFLNKSDMENIFKGDFKVTREIVCNKIYEGLNKGFAYFTLRPI